MTWTKLGDEFGDDAASLSDAAARTHVDALLWSNRRLLDLVIPKDDLRRFAFSKAVDIGHPDACPVVRELLDAGWWEDRHDAWFVGVRWPEWQRDREQVERDRSRETLKKRRQREHARGLHALCGPRCSSVPDPSRAGPGTPGGSPRGVSPRVVPGGTGGYCRDHPGQQREHCSGCASERKAVAS